MFDAGHHDGGVDEIEGVPPQLTPTPGMPERRAVNRRQQRVRGSTTPAPGRCREAIRDELGGTHRFPVHQFATDTASPSRDNG